MLETCAPESINMITVCLSTMMGASLDHPIRQAIESGFKNLVTPHGPLCRATLIMVSPGLESGWECGAHCWLKWLLLRGEPHSLSFPWLVKS